MIRMHDITSSPASCDPHSYVSVGSRKEKCFSFLLPRHLHTNIGHTQLAGLDHNIKNCNYRLSLLGRAAIYICIHVCMHSLWSTTTKLILMNSNLILAN